MQFEALLAIVPEDKEEEVTQMAKKAGAGGVNILKGRSIGLKEKKIFLGLTLEENVSVLFFILPKKILMPVFKTLKKELNLDFHDKEKEASGLLLTLPISHLSGINIDELELFEDEVKELL